VSRARWIRPGGPDLEAHFAESQITAALGKHPAFVESQADPALGKHFFLKKLFISYLNNCSSKKI